MNLTQERLEHLVVTLRLYHGLNDAEIVGLLGCPEQFYRATLKEGMRRMAKRLLPRLKNFRPELFLAK